MTLHLFNPENDLALAAGIDRYTPPRPALAMARCGRLLPMWLASEGDAVLVDDEAAVAEAHRLASEFGLTAKAVTKAPEGVTSCSPWGWSRAAGMQFRQAGVSSDILPSDGWLDRHRELSSRLTTISICRELGLEPPVAAVTPEDAIGAVAANESRGLQSFLKMPWSCSGRGVFATGTMTPGLIRRRCADIIRAQGAVMVEPDRRRESDFAALFRISGGRARFHGLSMFATGRDGNYQGNLVISDEAIVGRLGIDPTPWTERLQAALTAIVAPFYEGWAGVDMVTVAGGGIYPCIELNLRTTMGVVAAAMRPFFSRPMILAPSPATERPYLPQPFDK